MYSNQKHETENTKLNMTSRPKRRAEIYLAEGCATSTRRAASGTLSTTRLSANVRAEKKAAKLEKLHVKSCWDNVMSWCWDNVMLPLTTAQRRAAMLPLTTAQRRTAILRYCDAGCTSERIDFKIRTTKHNTWANNLIHVNSIVERAERISGLETENQNSHFLTLRKKFTFFQIPAAETENGRLCQYSGNLKNSWIIKV